MYFMPCSFVALGLSKICELTSPIFLGKAMDAMTRQEFPLMDLIIYGILRFGVSTFEEVQRLVYLRVKQAAYHETAVAAFRHVHSLSLHWHINKRSGVVMKAMDRGISSASTVVDMLVLRMVWCLILCMC
jgi:ABC-type multidrug transport system fused ATPase/permease subunit